MWAISVPRTEQEIATVINAFQKLSKLPYCVEAIDKSKIQQKAAVSSEYFEYRCFKGCTSKFLFVVSDSKRRFLYPVAVYVEVMGDSTIYNGSKLRSMIESGEWLGPEIPSLRIGSVYVRPYLIGDYAFTLNSNMMKIRVKSNEVQTKICRFGENKLRLQGSKLNTPLVLKQIDLELRIKVYRLTNRLMLLE